MYGLDIVQSIYYSLAVTLPLWFPIVMLIMGKSLILKIKNWKIRLVVLVAYTIFCMIFFLMGVSGL